MSGLDAKLPRDQEQGNTGEQNALEKKKEILAFLETEFFRSQVLV